MYCDELTDITMTEKELCKATVKQRIRAIFNYDAPTVLNGDKE